MSSAVLRDPGVRSSRAVRNRAVRNRAVRSHTVGPRRRWEPVSRTSVDVHRPRAAVVEYRTTGVEFTCAPHPHGEPDVTWKMVAASILVTAAVMLGLAGVANFASGRSVGESATEVIQVGEGETLTGLAARISPDSPVGQVVDRIMQLNAMSGAALDAGQSLIVPVSDQP